jgi:hypothetical protein
LETAWAVPERVAVGPAVPEVAAAAAVGDAAAVADVALVAAVVAADVPLVAAVVAAVVAALVELDEVAACVSTPPSAAVGVPLAAPEAHAEITRAKAMKRLKVTHNLRENIIFLLIGYDQ